MGLKCFIVRERGGEKGVRAKTEKKNKSGGSKPAPAQRKNYDKRHK